MPIDASIYNAFAPRVQSPLEIQNGLMQQASMASQMQNQQLDMQQKQDAFARAAALRQAVQASGGDRAKLRGAIVDSGDFAALDKHDKTQASVDKDQAAAIRDKLETFQKTTIEKARQFSAVNPNDNDAIANIMADMKKAGLLTDEGLAAEVQKAGEPNTPQRAAWYEQSKQMAQTQVERQHAQLEALKQQQQVRQFDVTDARVKSEGAANRGVQMRGQNMVDSRMRDAAAAAKEAGRAPPSGYEVDPANPGQLRPIAGGPHDPNGGGSQGSRAELMFNRVVSAGNEATAAIRNISELPITASTGYFGTAQPGTGLISSAKSVLGQKMTSQEAQETKVMFAGVSRALGAIETSGLQVNGQLMHSMDSIVFNEGDTHMTKLRKMAEVRQIVEKGLEPNLENPKIPEPQKALVRKIIGEIQAAVPYTHSDITKLQQSKNPQATIADFAKGSGVQAPTTNAYSDPEKEKRYQEWKARQGK